jgi:hypothetical protein
MEESGMSEKDEQLNKGKAMLEEIAQRYAGDHGLRPDRVEWESQGYEWLLRVIDAAHTVRLVFSADEIEMFAEDLPENSETKSRIRRAFSGLHM